MKEYVRIPLFSCGLAALLLLVSFSFSGSNTVQWNGQQCLPGTQSGFPLPFMYLMKESPSTPNLTHSTSVCISGNSVSRVRSNLPNAVLDYLFWFAVSLPIVFGLTLLFFRKAAPTQAIREEEPLILTRA
jgi:hypothetical protein